MPIGQVRRLNIEKTLFLLVTVLALSFVWRAGLVDAGLRGVGLPPARPPLPPVPGLPERSGVRIIDSIQEPTTSLDKIAVPDFWAPGVRNPFAGAFDSLRVVAARVTAQMTVTPAGGAGEVEIEYRILPHPVAEFEFLLPTGAQLTHVYGSGVTNPTQPEMRDLGADGRQYVVKLSSPVDRRYLLRLRLTWAKPPGRPVMKAPEIVLPDATHQRGTIILSAQRGMQVRVREAEGVSALDLNKLAPTLKRPGAFAAFSYRRPGYAVWLDVSGKADVTVKPPPEDTVVIKPKPPMPATNPNVKTQDPTTPKDPTPTATTAEVDKWTLPVGFSGTVQIGSTRYALIKDKDNNIRKVTKGDIILGMKVIEIKPTSVVLQNNRGERFEFKDPLRDKHEY